MTTRKTDRFEQIVARLPHYMTVAAMRKAIPALLRKQHAAYVRMVRAYRRGYQSSRIGCVKNGENPECWDMRIEACNSILATLTRYAEGKGKP